VQQSDRHIYDARIAEIETDLELGRIDQIASEAAKAEEARRFLRVNQSHNADIGSRSGPSGSVFAIILACLFIPIFSLALYFPQAGEIPQIDKPAVADGQQASLSELLEIAENRLKENPDDTQGWRVVVPVYMRAGRFDDAQKAFRNLIRLEGERQDLLQGLAEALMLKAGGSINDEALALFNKVLDANPENVRASYFIGLASMQRDDLENARTIWQGLVDSAKGDEPWLANVQQGLSVLDGKDAPVLSLTKEQLERVEGMVDGLARRLEEDTGTRDDWQRLVRSYLVLGRQEDARNAVSRAGEIFADDPDYLASLRGMITKPVSSEASQ